MPTITVGRENSSDIEIQASVEPWPQAGSVPERGLLSKSHISPGNLNRRLRVEVMYFL